MADHLVRKCWVEPQLLALSDAAAASAHPPATLQQETRESPEEPDLCAHTEDLFLCQTAFISQTFSTKDLLIVCARVQAQSLSCVRLFVTPWTSPPDSSEMAFPRQEYWSGLPCPPPEDLLVPGIKLASPALAGRFFITEPPSECL